MVLGSLLVTIVRVREGGSFVSDSPHVELIERSGSGTEN